MTKKHFTYLICLVIFIIVLGYWGVIVDWFKEGITRGLIPLIQEITK